MGITVLQLLLCSGVVFIGGGAELVRFCLREWCACTLLWSGSLARCCGYGSVDEALVMPLLTASFPLVALLLEQLQAKLTSVLSLTACGDQGVAPTNAASSLLRFRRSWQTALAATQ